MQPNIKHYIIILRGKGLKHLNLVLAEQNVRRHTYNWYKQAQTHYTVTLRRIYRFKTAKFITCNSKTQIYTHTHNWYKQTQIHCIIAMRMRNRFKTCKFSIWKGKTHTNKHYTITLNRRIGLNFVSIMENMHTIDTDKHVKHYTITLWYNHT